MANLDVYRFSCHEVTRANTGNIKAMYEHSIPEEANDQQLHL